MCLIPVMASDQQYSPDALQISATSVCMPGNALQEAYRLGKPNQLLCFMNVTVNIMSISIL